MPVNLTFESPDDENQNVVESEHFGINFVADYERIGDQPWEQFDEATVGTGAENIRYPGGITAETLFDITHPNSEYVILENGGTRAIMGAFDFAAFTNANGLFASFIIPTAPFLIEIPGQTQRGFNEEYTASVIDFVMGVLIASDGNISIFEIGNEYESHMTSAEYGILVNALAPLIAAAIDQYNSEFPDAQSNVQISVQAWSNISNEDSLNDTEDLYRRTERVFEQLDEDALEAIDSIVTHWYGRDRDRTYIETYYDLENDILDAISVLDAFSDNFQQQLDYIISEWNTHRFDSAFFGLANVPMIIRMFAEFVQAGVDQLDFWATQYHSNSLALPNGDLTPTGIAFAYLEDVAVGSTVLDLMTEDISVGGVAFVGEELTILSLSNLTELDHSYSFTFTLPENFVGRTTVSVGYLVVDISSSDGAYRDYSDLEPFNEPDLSGSIEWIEVSLNADDTMTIELEPYQTIFIEIPNEPIDHTEDRTGSSGNDHFVFSIDINSISGGFGVDTIDFSGFSHGVSIWTQDSQAEVGSSSGLSFDGIEIFIGTSYDDRLVIHTGDFEASLGAGNDTLVLGEAASGRFDMQEGDDFVIGYSRDAYIYAGEGDDTIFSYCGMIIEGGRGNDTLHSASLFDTFIFQINDGNDTIIGFDIGTDQLIVGEAVTDAVVNSEFEIVASDDGAVFNLFDGGSITFYGMTVEEVGSIVGWEQPDTINGTTSNDIVDW